jgi:hypothetical protein
VITPYVQVNGGAWQQTAGATVATGGTVKFGPQPSSGGSWRWTGPNNYQSSAREITLGNTSTSQGGTYVATHTNDGGCQSTLGFTLTVTNGGGTWRKANLTWFTSYPDPNSEECVRYNGCTWAGYFAFVNGKQPESWVQSHNIAAVHSRDANTYKLKTLRLKQGTRQIDVVVYDMCADSDCNGCCTQNADAGGIGFLIDIESYTKDRFGSGSGIVDWMCLDCP